MYISTNLYVTVRIYDTYKLEATLRSSQPCSELTYADVASASHYSGFIELFIELLDAASGKPGAVQ